VNRNPRTINLDVTLDAEPIMTRFRKYTYDPAHVPQHPFGDLPGPAGRIALQDDHLRDTVGPNTLTVYTTAYHDRPPKPVSDLKVERFKGRDRLSWEPNPEPDLCYYRVFRSDSSDADTSTTDQIGSTIAAHFTVPSGKGHYKVLAVDRSGNVGPADPTK
jgi:hypothetical protein